MAQPGMPSARGEDWLVRKVQQLERDMVELRAANPFAPMAIRPMKDGLIVDGYETINGPLTVNGASVFNGALSIMGALTLQPGIIGNDALANPLKTGSAGYTATNQSFTTAPTTYGTQVIAVPDGFTQAVVLNGVSGGGTNSGTGVDFIYVAASINGSGGGETPTRADTGQYASASAFGIRTLTGLTAGSTVSVGVQVRTNTSAWAAAAANIVNVNAIVIFYR